MYMIMGLDFLCKLTCNPTVFSFNNDDVTACLCASSRLE